MNADEFWLQPQSDYASRQRAFLEFSVEGDTAEGREAIVSQIARLELARGPVDEGIIREAVAFVDARYDCADFVVASLLRILYQHAGSPLLSRELVEAIGVSVRGFKYWISDQGADPPTELMCFWTENHQLGFHSCEYLAGQRFPDVEFGHTGQLGCWHRDRARAKILRWIDVKARYGFSEWDSNNYFRINALNLLNLADFSQDDDVASRAAMMLDLTFFDMAVDSYRGSFGCSHGRTYPRALVTARGEATSALQRIAWGMGSFGDPHNGAALFLAISPRYRVAQVVQDLAQDMPSTFSPSSLVFWPYRFRILGSNSPRSSTMTRTSSTSHSPTWPSAGSLRTRPSNSTASSRRACAGLPSAA